MFISEIGGVVKTCTGLPIINFTLLHLSLQLLKLSFQWLSVTFNDKYLLVFP